MALGLPLLALLSAAGGAARGESIAVRSNAGHFIVRIMGVERTEHLNRMHGLDLSLTTADGRLAPGATVVLTGQRRYSSTALPTIPEVTAAPEPGRYRVRGLRFHMPGEWRLAFDINFAQIHDRVLLDVVVK